MARLRAAVRRNQAAGPEQTTVAVGALEIDLARKRVARDGNDVRLTPTEWGFDEQLTRHLGVLVSREQILREVWGSGYEHESHYLRVYAAQLRRKLEDDPQERRIATRSTLTQRRGTRHAQHPERTADTGWSRGMAHLGRRSALFAGVALSSEKSGRAARDGNLEP